MREAAAKHLATPPQANDYEPGSLASAKPAPTYTPMQAVRKTCVYCAHSTYAVKDCEVTSCPLHKLRHGKRVTGVSAVKQMRRRCVDCMGGQFSLIEGCADRDCPSWPYRFGKRPATARREGKNV